MPRKSIKIEQGVYDRLDNIRGKHETFSECIARLVSLIETVKEIGEPIREAHHLRDRAKEEEDTIIKARLQRADLESRTL